MACMAFDRDPTIPSMQHMSEDLFLATQNSQLFFAIVTRYGPCRASQISVRATGFQKPISPFGIIHWRHSILVLACHYSHLPFRTVVQMFHEKGN